MKAVLHHSSVELKPENPVLLVTGDGRSLLEDYDAFRQMNQPHDVAAIGRSIKVAGHPAGHWFNADGETAMAWAKQVRAEYGVITHTLGAVDGFDVDWDVEQPDYHYATITNEKGRIHGSSAMFATLAGLAMGYEKVVLAGCPMDTNGHFYFEPTPETLGPLWLGVDFAAWMDFSMNGSADRARSMSGYTAYILGRADKKWLETED